MASEALSIPFKRGNRSMDLRLALSSFQLSEFGMVAMIEYLRPLLSSTGAVACCDRTFRQTSSKTI